MGNRTLLLLVLGPALLAGCKDKTASTGPPVARCALSTLRLDFGPVLVGSRGDLTFDIENSGSDTLHAQVASGCGAFETAPAGPVAVPPQGSRRVVVSFAPEAAGAESCQVAISGGCGSLVCAGSGVQASCGVEPAVLEFGSMEVGRSRTLPFLIRNTGSAPLTGGIGADCAAFRILADSAAWSLAPGESLQVLVRFEPVSPGADTCRIAVGGECGEVVARGTGF